MKFIISIILVVLFPCGLIAQYLMPIPQKVEYGSSKFRLSKFKNLEVQGTKDKLTLKAAKRASERIKKLSGVTVGGVVMVKFQATKQNEEYELHIGQRGISIVAGSPTASIRAFETLTQLYQHDNSGGCLPYVDIQDFPKFAWRGMMVDVARHFIPLDVMKRNVDAMAAAKMNVLHLHLSDDEGFRIESKRYPKLHELGSEGLYFTQEQIKDLVNYCSDRGIIVYPEFDLPGHSQSWFAGYPELASEAKTYKPGPRFSIPTDKPMGMAQLMQMMTTASAPTLDPTKESTYEFLDNLMEEMKFLFPAGFIHWGLDENNGVAWKNNPKIVGFMAENKIANTHELQDYFLQRVNKIAEKHGLQSIAWEEAFNEKTPKNVMIQAWKPAMMGPSLGIEGIQKQGNQGILSRGFYLDLFLPAYIHYSNKDINQTSTWRGGEAALWSELVDGNVFESRTWPRSLAIAERLWTNPANSDMDEMYTRLFQVESYLNKLGIQSNKGISQAIAQNPTMKHFLLILTPVRGYKRLISEMLVPANQKPKNFVEIRDVVPCDSREAFAFRMKVKKYLQSGDKTEVISALQQWTSLDVVNLPELKSLNENFGNICRKTIQLLQKDSSISAKDILEEIKSARKPAAGLEVGIWDEMEGIVSGQLKDRPINISLF